MNAVFGKITSKAQTTLPKEVREALGVKPGDMLVYRIAKGKVTLARAEPQADWPPLLSYVNRLSDLLFVLARAANAGAGVADSPC